MGIKLRTTNTISRKFDKKIKNIKIIGTNYAVIQYYINELIKKSKKSIKIYKTSIDFYC